MDINKFTKIIPTNETYRVYYQNFDEYCLNIVVGKYFSYRYSSPEDVELDISKYDYVRIYFSKPRNNPDDEWKELGSKFISDLEKKIGLNEISYRREAEMCFSNVKIKDLFIIYNNMLSFSSIKEEQEKPQPCSVCKFNDKWNCKQNNKWFCYQHCSY
jgi:hypothetical protein